MGEFREFTLLDMDYKHIGAVCIRRGAVAYAVPSGVRDGSKVVLTTSQSLRLEQSYAAVRAWTRGEMPLIELPGGDWISPEVVKGIRVIIDRDHGPRVILDLSLQIGVRVVEFDAPEAARAWALGFGLACNAALASVAEQHI